jgi:phosphotriesterase-related protein
MSATVRTVLGPIPSESLGVTLAHEHLIMNGTAFRQDPRVVLDDPAVACAELKEFKELGGSAVVDLTPVDLARDPVALEKISRETGLHVVMGTAFYTEVSYPEFVRKSSVEEIARLFVHELREGAGETGVRAGIIGEIGTSQGAITRDEHKVFRAAALAQRETGAAIATHTYWGELGLEQLELLREARADLSRVVVGHLDLKMDFEYHRAVAAGGAFVAYDCVGKTFFDVEFGVQFPSDPERAEMVVRMVGAGFARQLLLSSDICKTNYLRRHGGWGYACLLREFVPLLRERGLDEGVLHTILVENPRRLLAF